MFAADFREVKELKIPVYFFLGRHDWNVPSVLIEEFAKNLKAPKKEIVGLKIRPTALWKKNRKSLINCWLKRF